MGKKKSFEEYYKEIPKEKSDTIGFNLRSAYENLPDSVMQRFKNDTSFHLTDRFKTPKHVTFSTGSDDKSVKGGKWVENPNGSFEFYAEEVNIKNGERYEGGLQGYFDKYEKNAKLILPPKKDDRTFIQKLMGNKPIIQRK